MSKELRFYFEYDWQSAVLRRAIFEKPTPLFSSDLDKGALKQKYYTNHSFTGDISFLYFFLI